MIKINCNFSSTKPFYFLYAVAVKILVSIIKYPYYTYSINLGPEKVPPRATFQGWVILGLVRLG